jgi:lipoprotein-anchoring transpeptidase ErfK/SrfK
VGSYRVSSFIPFFILEIPMTWKIALALSLLLTTATPALANDLSAEELLAQEFNPFASDADQKLEAFDAIYEQETGLSPFLETDLVTPAASCYRESCRVWIDVDKATQTARLYLDGRYVNQWLVSSGTNGHGTPNVDTHPNGRIYQRYSSKKFPGGDFAGLGNMPYAVFIRGGFALHGTPTGNWSKLGRRASHGCIRMHPDNAAYFNQLVRSVGVRQTWITVR